MPEPLEPSLATANGADAYTIEELIPFSGRELWTLDARRLANTSPYVVASFLERLDVGEARTVLRKLDEEHASAVLAEMDPDHSSEIVSAMREARAIKILEDLDPDDAADLVHELDPEDRERLFERLDPKIAGIVRDLMTYDPETAGGVMTPEVATIRAGISVDDAIGHIRRLHEQYENIFYVYVIDERRRLQGVISMRDLILARPHQKISDIMIAEVKGVSRPDEDREKVALKMAEFNLQALPVVDETGRLLGIVTHDDVLDIIQQEATEDIQLLVGAGADESIHDNIRYSFTRRGPWLVVNLITAIAASAVIYLFEDTLAQLTLLAVFMPIIASMGGNTGSQTLAIAIRSLALGEVQPKDGLAVCLREATKGFCTGVVIGIISGLSAWAWTGNGMLGAVIFAAMVLNMIIAGISGALIPLMLQRFHLDPAQSSTIFLTTVTDIAGFGIFLGLGTLLLL